MEPEQELRNALFLAQYQTAREVVLHARQIRHSIVSWSNASAGVLIGAGAVIANRGAGAVTDGTSGIAFLLLFALVLPGLVAGLFNAWIGEVGRMRRAANFVRDIEFSIFASLGPGIPTTPVYDTVVSRGPNGEGDSITEVGRRAVAFLYFGLLATSVSVASACLWTFDLPPSHATVGRVVGQVLLVGILVWFAHAVRDGFRSIAPYGSRQPTLIDEPYLVELFGDRD